MKELTRIRLGIILRPIFLALLILMMNIYFKNTYNYGMLIFGGLLAGFTAEAVAKDNYLARGLTIGIVFSMLNIVIARCFTVGFSIVFGLITGLILSIIATALTKLVLNDFKRGENERESQDIN